MGCVSSLDDIKFKYPLYSDILRTRRRRCFCRCISSIRDGRFQDYLDEMIAAFCLFNSDTCLPQPWMNDIHSRCLLDVLVICISNKSIYIYICLYISVWRQLIAFCLTSWLAPIVQLFDPKAPTKIHFFPDYGCCCWANCVVFCTPS